jgi:cyclic pyranopterin monophosphate synthase
MSGESAGLSHLDEQGKARMVDVTDKEATLREAVARGRVVMSPRTLALIVAGGMPKGDVLGVARIAAVMAAKQTGVLIPLCHPLELTGIDVAFATDPVRGVLAIEARVRTMGRTGVEMEAMTAVAVAALTIYDMCKAVDRGMTITDIMLVAKRGGKSGAYERPQDA